MIDASLLGRHEQPSAREPVPDDNLLVVWLHRSLARQYDGVLSEDLPPSLLDLAREAAVGR